MQWHDGAAHRIVRSKKATGAMAGTPSNWHDQQAIERLAQHIPFETDPRTKAECIEMLREIVLQPYLRYDDEKFVGLARSDRTVSAGLEGRYLLNQHLAAYAGYAFQQRDTNAAGRSFTSNVFTFGLRAQL